MVPGPTQANVITAPLETLTGSARVLEKPSVKLLNEGAADQLGAGLFTTTGTSAATLVRLTPFAVATSVTPVTVFVCPPEK